MNDLLLHYRPISIWAIASMLATGLACFAYLAPLLIVFAIRGVIAGGIAISEIRKYGHLGQPYAVFGFLTSLFIVVTDPPFQLMLYHLELPTGHMRVDFAKLTKSKDSSLEEHLGRKIYLKGYAYPQR